MSSAPEVDPDDPSRLTVHYAGRTFRVPPSCPHRGAPLREAALLGPYLRCAWHGATFDVRSGARLRGPDCPDLAVVPADVPAPVSAEVSAMKVSAREGQHS